MPTMEYWRAQMTAGDEKTSDRLLLVLTLPNGMGGSIDCQIRCSTVDEFASIARIQGHGTVTARSRFAHTSQTLRGTKIRG